MKHLNGRDQIKKAIAMSVIRMAIRKYYETEEYGNKLEDVQKHLKNTLDADCLNVWEELGEDSQFNTVNKIYREFNKDSLAISPYYNVKHALDRYYSRNTIDSITINEVKDYYYNSIEEEKDSVLSETDNYGRLLIADYNNNHYQTEEVVRSNVELIIYDIGLAKHKEDEELLKYLFSLPSTDLEEELKEELNYNNYKLWENLGEETKYKLCNEYFKKYNKIDLPK